MSEHWHPGAADGEGTAPVAHPTEPTRVVPVAWRPGGTDAPAGAFGPSAADAEGAPTAPTPPTVPGSPTPPLGTVAPPPQGWAAGSWAAAPPPTGGWYGGGQPPYGGWPSPDPAATPASPGPVSRTGLAVVLALVLLVTAALAGAGLGHEVWPSQSAASNSTSGSSSSPFGSGSTGSGSSPFGGSSGGGYSPFGGGSSSGGDSPSGGSSSSSGNAAAGAPSDISAIAAKVSPALVDINTTLDYQNEQAAGTGMVLTSNGEILTNNHVIEGASTISVTDVGNGKTYSATVVGYDRTGDVAVIQLKNASGLQTVNTASGSPSVGQAVVGVGNAGGTGGTPSAVGGSITALDQAITASDDGGGNAENLTGLIETNADIEPGDSGGSLVNTSDQVIGMDTAASTGSGYNVSSSQAYAIPISTALAIARQIESGTSTDTVHIGASAFIGVSVESSGSTGSGDSGGFSFGNGSSGGGSDSSTAGAQIEQVLSGSPAASAGLVAGDTITGIDGTSIGSAEDLSNAMTAYHPGQTVQLQWTDGSGQSHTASVTLTSGPPE